MSFSEIKDDCSSIFFLKRQQLLKLSDGLLIVPGTTTGKMVAYFEKFFGVARNQKIPCDSSIQNDDESQLLNDGDSKAYRSVIGLFLYVARDRVDVMYAMKELSSCMSCPTVCALQRLRKLFVHQWQFCMCFKQNPKRCLIEFSRARVAQHGFRLLRCDFPEALHGVPYR